MSPRALIAAVLCAGCFSDPPAALPDAGQGDALAKDSGAHDVTALVDEPVAPADTPDAGVDAGSNEDSTATDALGPHDVSIDAGADAEADAASGDVAQRDEGVERDAPLDVPADAGELFDVTNNRDVLVPTDTPPRARRGGALELTAGSATMRSSSYRLSLEVRADTLPQGVSTALDRRLRLGTQAIP